MDTIKERSDDLADFAMETWPTPKHRFSDIESPSEAIPRLTDEERHVLEALCEEPE